MIGNGVVFGRDCRVGAHASVSHALIGHRVYIYTGARIGQDGFGFAVADTGFLTVPQIGRVLIGDDVEIGANTTIDRGSMQDTVIGAGTRIDNLVMIGHNVSVGRSCRQHVWPLSVLGCEDQRVCAKRVREVDHIGRWFSIWWRRVIHISKPV